jgi:hypothetical protein
MWFLLFSKRIGFVQILLDVFCWLRGHGGICGLNFDYSDLNSVVITVLCKGWLKFLWTNRYIVAWLFFLYFLKCGIVIMDTIATSNGTAEPRKPGVSKCMICKFFCRKNLISYLSWIYCEWINWCKQGKYKAMIVCFILGLGSLVSWNSMLTIGDYYYKLFPVSNTRLGFAWFYRV